jgi:hypothetical protein
MRMNVLGTILRFFRLCFLGLLSGYWAIFLSYTGMKLICGGPKSLWAWFRYIGQPPLVWDGKTFVLHEFKWDYFWAAQVIYLAVTWLFCFFEWRSSRKRIKK